MVFMILTGYHGCPGRLKMLAVLAVCKIYDGWLDVGYAGWLEVVAG
jgi:hypothetical protein